MCYNQAMASVGLRELRQDASELVRRAQDGEEIDVTVSGRPAARLVPAAPKRWQSWDDVADVLVGRPDPEWDQDRDLIDQLAVQPLGAHSLKAILDTSIVIATDVQPLEGELAISVATLAELHFGVLVTKDATIRAERLRRLSELQRKFDALPLDDDVATSYGELAAAVVASGRQPRSRVMDILIAATAHAHAARLYTRNASDFAGIDHLVEIVPA